MIDQFEIFYADGVIPIKSLHGEFDCFLALYDTTLLNRYYSVSVHYNTTRKTKCHTRLNVMGSPKNWPVSNHKTTTPQTAVTTSAKPKMATVITPKVTLQHTSKPTSTDAPKDLPAVWTYVSVGLAVVIVVLGAAVLICVYRRQRGRNTTKPDPEHN
ncbi:uncharacterized protein LOC113229302 [Hyposmocoma kahamanoa]|uniref:uncharacterized protein LOC113229302 n=1 Tax=Hyposmocoma kahamanoa TaxID=1477025 RepID=UPI000E6D8C79|nr:uncharacterized protein LOC113229302 [Hyposmocoma kahamanoa]